jgi:RNA polymerase sigma factor (TIGR02999 family)
MTTKENITQLLNQWIKGDQSHENQLIKLVYPQLRKIAHAQLSKDVRPYLNTTLIVNELYFKLKKHNRIQIQDKSHFFALSAIIIRRLVVDLIRSKDSYKHSNVLQQVTLDDDMESNDKSSPINTDWLTIDKLLNELAKVDPVSVKIIELRFFVGLSIPETAKVMNTSESSISRSWKFAKSWLLNKLKE